VPETLELQWDPEPADWADGLRATVPIVRFAPAFAGVFAVVGVVLALRGQPWGGVLGMALAVVIALFPLAAVRASFHRNPVAATTVTAKVDDHSLRMMTIDGTAYSDVDWTSLSGWLETRRGFVLRTGTGRASPFYPVPNRAFAEPEQRQHFQDLLRRRLGQN
jgi:YcxB-like protein